MDQLILLSQGLFLAELGLGAWLCFQSAKKTDAETLDGNDQISALTIPDRSITTIVLEWQCPVPENRAILIDRAGKVCLCISMTP